MTTPPLLKKQNTNKIEPSTNFTSSNPNKFSNFQQSQKVGEVIELKRSKSRAQAESNSNPPQVSQLQTFQTESSTSKNQSQVSNKNNFFSVFYPRYFIKGSAELIDSFPSNQNTLYLLCLFYSDNEIITVCCRPEICTLIGWFKSSHLFISMFVSMKFNAEYH